MDANIYSLHRILNLNVLKGHTRRYPISLTLGHSLFWATWMLLLNPQCFNASICILPKKHDLKPFFLNLPLGKCTFSIVNFIFLGIHAVTIIFSTQKLFLTVFCHFVLVYCSLEEKLFLIFYKSDFFYSRSLCRHGKNWFWQNWIGMWIWSSLRTILICSASIWISCQRLMMPINEVPPRMKKQVMIYHTSIKPNFYLTQNKFFLLNHENTKQLLNS